MNQDVRWFDINGFRLKLFIHIKWYQTAAAASQQQSPRNCFYTSFCLRVKRLFFILLSAPPRLHNLVSVGKILLKLNDPFTFMINYITRIDAIHYGHSSDTILSLYHNEKKARVVCTICLKVCNMHCCFNNG